MLNVSVYKHPDEFPSDVQQLFAVGEQASVEFSASWYRNLVNTVYAADDGVRIYVLRKNGHPVAALPVRVKKTIFKQHVESLGNYYTALYAPLIEKGVEVRDMVPLISAVRDAHARLGSLRFAPMDPESTSFRTLLGALQASGLVPFRFFCFGNWYLQVNDDWSTYLRNREGMLRSTIKRMTKKFLAEGGTLELVQGGASLDRGLAAYERVYASSWKKPEPYPEFIPGLIRTCADKGWLRLGIAWLDGKAIGAQFWIVANGKASIYKLAYDEHFKAYASGTLLTAMLMEHVIEKDNVTGVDYLIGDDPYKKTWMSLRRERWGIVAYNPKTILGIVGLSKEVCGRTLKPIATRVRVFVRNMWRRLPT
ncbi:MAG TPA: GNAT family N-acetyltransferase [Polaromonas sp.]|nr:GNAT family N-acetyltransferase [Polaromonas sp.]